MTTLRRVVLLAFFVLLLVGGWRFASENGAVVSIDYVLGRTAEISLWLALLLAAAAGVIVTGAWLGWALMRARLEARRYRKAMVKLESEVHQLRNLPVVAEDPIDSGAVTAVLGEGAAQSG